MKTFNEVLGEVGLDFGALMKGGFIVNLIVKHDEETDVVEVMDSDGL